MSWQSIEPTQTSWTLAAQPRTLRRTLIWPVFQFKISSRSWWGCSAATCWPWSWNRSTTCWDKCTIGLHEWSRPGRCACSRLDYQQSCDKRSKISKKLLSRRCSRWKGSLINVSMSSRSLAWSSSLGSRCMSQRSPSLLRLWRSLWSSTKTSFGKWPPSSASYNATFRLHLKSKVQLHLSPKRWINE